MGTLLGVHPIVPWPIGILRIDIHTPENWHGNIFRSFFQPPNKQIKVLTTTKMSDLKMAYYTPEI